MSDASLVSYTATNPRTGGHLSSEPIASGSAIEDTLGRLSASFEEHRLSSVASRQEFCRKAAAAIRRDSTALTETIVLEVGKLRYEAAAEVEKCAVLCDYYAEQLPELLRCRKVAVEDAYARVEHQPLGVILGIMPWNYPMWQVARFCIPAIAVGNVALLKHAPNVPECARLFVDTISAAAGDRLLMANLRLSNEQAATVISDPRIKGVSLTGSTAAGKAIGALAADAIKPVVLELGGSDAYVVLADADLDVAVEQCFTARVGNAGQSCISAKRMIVVDAVLQEFTDRMLARCAPVRPANRVAAAGEAEHGRLAPLVREDIRCALHDQVKHSIAQGAVLKLGGVVPEGQGFYYPLTVLTNAKPGMACCEEELFGPVIVIMSAADTDDAIRLANQTAFGLGAAIFSRDVVAAERLASEQLRAGSCFVNAAVRSDPRLPFGGVDISGHGRELAREGLLAFTNTKTVYVALT